MMRRMAALIGTLCALLALASTGLAQGIERARASVRSGQYELALDLLRQDAELEDSPEALTLQGEILTLLGQHREAAVILRPLAHRPDPRSDTFLAYAELLVSRGQLDQALDQLDRAVSLDPEDPAARLARGLLQERIGHESRAQRDFQEIVATYQAGTVNSAAQMTAVGVAYQHLGRHEEANSIFGLAVNMDPQSLDAKLAWANLLFQKYRPDEAEQLAREILTVNPRHPQANVLVARSLLILEHDSIGADHFIDVALQVNPNLPEAQELLAEMAIEEEDFEQAIERLERLIEINPTRLEALSLLAASYRLLGRTSEFERLEEQVRDINRNYPAFPTTVADLAARLGRQDDAIAAYRQALSMDPTYTPALLGLGIALTRTGEHEAGLANLRQARENDPFNIQAYHMVSFYESDLADYELVESEHLRFRFHREERQVLERYVAPTAEWIYNQYIQRYQFQPEGPITIEMFPDAATLAVRATGFTHVDAYGVSFGNVLALRSPRAGTFNWAEVLAHELSHVITFQLSHARIPRFLAEGMAEYDTHLLRTEWRREEEHALMGLLEVGELPGILELNRAFLRSTDAVQMSAAYFQSMLVVEFLSNRWGTEAPLRILRRLAQGRRLDDVLTDITGLGVEPFDTAFRGYLEERLAPFAGYIEPSPVCYRDIEQLQETVRADPGNATAWADLAMARFFALDMENTELALRRTLDLDGENPMGHLLSGWFAARQRLLEDAEQHFRQILDAGFDGYNVRLGLAAVARRQGRTSEAILHYQQAQRIYPMGAESYRNLADILIRSDESSLAVEQLKRLVLLDQSDIQPVMTLLRLLFTQQRFDEAWTACSQGNHIAPFRLELHEICGRVAMRLERWGDARQELETAALLAPGSSAETLELIEQLSREHNGAQAIAPTP